MAFLIVGPDQSEIFSEKPGDLGALTERMSSVLPIANAALSRIKDALFTPFKVDADVWPSAALCLLIYQFSHKVNLTNYDRDRQPMTRWPKWKMEPDWSPLHYAPFLEFVLKICKEAKSRPRSLSVAECAVSADTFGKQELCIELAFEADNRQASYASELDTDEDEKRKLAKRLWEFAARGLNEAYVVQGNFQRPFVELASRIGSGAMEGNSEWSVVRPEDFPRPASQVLVVKRASANRLFEIRVGQTVLLRWAPIEERHL
jgi:hypothetical protein